MTWLFGTRAGRMACANIFAPPSVSELPPSLVENANPIRFASLTEMGSLCRYENPRHCKSNVWDFGTRNGNRTHNYPLGGGYYIHLTMQA